jgi:hypothetical protein
MASHVAIPPSLAAERPIGIFVVLALAFVATACILAGALPIGFSIVTVFLFAGPHNWVELRYFLARTPPRWGPLAPFFAIGVAGVLALTALFMALTWMPIVSDYDHWLTALATWNSLLVLWIALLVDLRSRQNPRRNWFVVWPIALAIVAAIWLTPLAMYLVLVYLHPLIGLWILDRELRRNRSPWRPAYHACLACLPLFVAALWLWLWNAPNLPGDDVLVRAIRAHAGAEILQNVSSHLLVATHTFLEMIHYGVWLLAIPLASGMIAPWRSDARGLARRSFGWRRLIAGGLAASAAVVVLLWACFLIDYPVTRDVYFTVAMFHVLAEAPFLLRAL